MNEFIKKKSLGQHFLRNKQILSKVVQAIDPKIKTLIEIGPGEGTLTELLLERSATLPLSRVICIEKDDRLIPILQEKFAKQIKNKKLTLIHSDFLEVSDSDIKNIVAGKKTTADKDGADSYAMVGNIPYYITGAIFEKSLESKHPPKEIVFLIQKEVADRICGRGAYEVRRKTTAGNVSMNQKESILSMSVKVFGNPEYVATVDKGQFIPPPKVDSAIIKIGDISHDLFKKNKVSIPAFFETLKLGFSHKRKVLRSNLGLNKMESEDLTAQELSRITKLGNMRAEDLVLEDWFFLTKIKNK